MAESAEIKFVKLTAPTSGSAVLLTDEKLKLGAVSAGLAGAAGNGDLTQRRAGADLKMFQSPLAHSIAARVQIRCPESHNPEPLEVREAPDAVKP